MDAVGAAASVASRRATCADDDGASTTKAVQDAEADVRRDRRGRRRGAEGRVVRRFNGGAPRKVRDDVGPRAPRRGGVGPRVL